MIRKILLVLALCAVGYADPYSGSQYTLMNFDFAAPTVYGNPTVVDSKVGSIIYDLSTNTFRGLFASGNWQPIAVNSYISPTIQKFTTGSGTYTTPANVKWIRVRMVGGGGGGAGSGPSAGAGGNGGNSTFGTSLLSAGGGLGNSSASGGQGGSSSLGAGPTGLALTGGAGSSFAQVANGEGGVGGSSAFGGNGGGGYGNSSAGTSGSTNTGGGGGGAGGFAGWSGAAGGGAGGYVDAIITSPAPTYSYSVGSSGTGGSPGTSGYAGGAGGSGIIIVEEHYQ